MSNYTATIIFSLLVAVPIIILIYQTVSSLNKATNFSLDKRLATTNGASGQKFHVKRMNVDYAKSNIRRKQDTVTPIRAETLASVDRSLKIVAMKVPEIVNIESECKPFDTKVSANTY